MTDATQEEGRPRPLYAAFAWFVLCYNLFVILVGTVVRATRSGDGCGSHWPLCDGQVIPTDPSVARVIEWTHRMVSGVDGVFVLALVGVGVYLFRRQKRHPIHFALLATLLLTGVEAWIGRHLVVKGLVADNASAQRAVWMALHLCNTFLLLTALTLSAWWASGRERLRLAGQGAVGVGLAIGFLGMMLLGASGAVTALGDTLFPVRDHADAMQQSLGAGAHFLQKMRLLHPYIAGSVGLYLLLMAGLTAHLRPSPAVKRYAHVVAYLFLFQCALGGLNVFLKAPVWMQVLHLLVADVVWVYAVLLTAAATALSVPRLELSPVGVQAQSPELMASARPTWKDYVLLTKPRVISLLLFTTLTAMVMAAGGWPGTGLFLAVALGGYMAAGAANAINMVIDRDIDGVMKRTSGRPTVTQLIPSGRVLLFGLALAVGSFAVLFAAANLLTAMLSLAGLVFYVLVYTLLLKRRTWHNIVIGGAAGAFPPLVGWAAVTGSLSPLAWYLFAIVFVWTPAHFWALALLIKDDYEAAGVPMLPVVLGERVTVIQIALYAVLTAVISMLPLAQGLVGWQYIGAALVLNLVLIARSLQLYVRIDRPRAVSMHLYAMAYLALLFLALALEKAGVFWQGVGVMAAAFAVLTAASRLRRRGATPAATA